MWQKGMDEKVLYKFVPWMYQFVVVTGSNS